MKPTKQTTPKRKPVPKTKPYTSPPSAPPSPSTNTMPSPSQVRELTRLRFTRQETDQRLSELRSTVVQQRTARSFRRRVGRFDDDVFTVSGPTTRVASPTRVGSATRVGSGPRLALAVTEDRYQVAAVELAVVEMEVELVHWRNWLGGAAHERGSCDQCLMEVVNKEASGNGGLSKRGKERRERSGGLELSPLNWEKRGSVISKRSGSVGFKTAGSVLSDG